MPAVTIAPSILAGDFARPGEECRALGEAGADRNDVDGRLVPPMIFGAQSCAALRPHVRGTMDVQRMVDPADPHIEPFARAGADSLTIHPEARLALNPGSGIGAVSHLLDDIELLCAMTVNPGFGGRALIPAMVD